MTLNDKKRSVIIGLIEYENKKFKTPESATEVSPDMTIIFNDHKIPVSKTLIKRSSPFFTKMFDSKFQEAEANEVDIQFDVDVAIIKEILKYIQTGHLQLSTENLESVCRAASYFMLLDLTQFCCNVFKEKIDCETVDYIHEFGNDNHFPEISKAALSFKEKHFHAVWKSDIYLEWSKKSIEELLCSDHVQVLNEVKVVLFVFGWVQFDFNERFEAAAELFRKIRYSYLLNERKTEVKNMDEIMGSDKNGGQLVELLKKIANEFSGKNTPARIYREGIYLLGRSVDKTWKVERYVPTDDSVETLQPPGLADNVRDARIVVCNNNDIYVLSRLEDDLCIHAYHPLTNTWTARASMKLGGNTSYRACGFENEIYVFVTNQFLSVMVYYCKTDSWVSRPNKIPAEYVYQAVAYEDSIYLGTNIKKIIRFKPSTRELTCLCLEDDFDWYYGALFEKAKLVLFDVRDIDNGNKRKAKVTVFDTTTKDCDCTKHEYVFDKFVIDTGYCRWVNFNDSFYIYADHAKKINGDRFKVDGLVYKVATMENDKADSIKFSQMDWFYVANMTALVAASID